MLSVIEKSAGIELTTFNVIQADLGALVSDADRSTVERKIRAASAAIIDHCHQSFALETVEESVPGYGSNFLMLSRTPIVEVVSILCDSSPVTDFTIDDAEAGILYRAAGWIWTAQLGWDLTGYVRPRSEEPKFIVKYKAGYTLPKYADDGSYTLPDSIVEACSVTVEAWFINKDQDQSVRSESVGDLSVTYSERSDPTALPNLAQQLLRRWVRTV